MISTYLKFRFIHMVKAVYFTIATIFFRIFPIQENKLLFSSFNGKNFSGNPKAMSESPNNRGNVIVWVYKKPAIIKAEHPDWIVVKPFGLRSLYHMITAGSWIVNTNVNPYIRKRKKQTYIQTWHGIPLKTIGEDVPVDPKDKRMLINMMDWKKDSARWDQFVSPDPDYNTIFLKAFSLGPEILINKPYPRNRVLQEGLPKEQIDKLKKNLQIPTERKIILYAPTYREGKFTIRLPFDCVSMMSLLKDKAILLLKMHPHIKSILIPEETKEFCKDISWHEDINELFLLTDILITDYSSVLFDFRMTDKPIVFYPYDYIYYQEHERSFYRPYKEITGDDPICYNEEELFFTLQKLVNE